VNNCDGFSVDDFIREVNEMNSKMSVSKQKVDVDTQSDKDSLTFRINPKLRALRKFHRKEEASKKCRNNPQRHK